jgi:acyl carrier protein
LNTKETIKTLMVDILNTPKGEITDTSGREELPNWDSLQHLNIILALEQELGLQFDAEDIAAMHTDVATMVSLVEERLG